MSVSGAATLLIGVTLIGQLLGFLRMRFIATNITELNPGASDAFFAAFQIPDFFYFTISAGVLGVAFIPFLSDRLQAGDKKGVWDLTNSLLNVLTLVMAAVGAIMFFFAQPIIHALFPNLHPENLHQAVTVMRLIAFNPLFFTLAGVITSTQQTFGRFFFFAVAPLFYNIAIIISIFVFKDNLGVIGLGVGALIGSLLQLLIAILGMWGLGYRYRWYIGWKSNQLRAMLRQLPPRALDQGIDQVNSIVEVNRAQALSVGSVSNYSFAFALHNVPVMLLGNAIAIAAFPRLTERLSQGRPDLFRRDFLKILSVMIWIALPVVVVSYFARAYLARLIYGDVKQEIALIFGFLAAAIFFRIIYSILSRYFYAYKDTVTPLLVSILAIGLNIYLAFTLASKNSYGVAGLALAQSIVAGVEVGILGIIIVIRDKRFFGMQFIDVMVRMLSATGFTVVAAYAMIQLLPLDANDRGFFVLVGKLAAISGVTVGIYMLISLLLRLEEPKPVIERVKRIILKPVRIQ